MTPFKTIEEIIEYFKNNGVHESMIDFLARLTETAKTMELVNMSAWKSDPVTALLTNALRLLNNEQMKSLAHSLAERCGMELQSKYPEVTPDPTESITVVHTSEEPTTGDC